MAQPELIAGTDCVVVVTEHEQLAARMEAYLAERREHASAWEQRIADSTLTLDELVCPTCDAFLPDHELDCARA